jgi:hypothetical protein
MAHKLLKLGGDVGAWFRQLGTGISTATVEDIQQSFTGSANPSTKVQAGLAT